MAVVTIIGKNSNLYKMLNLEKFRDSNNVIEISFTEIDKLSNIENPIIFSYSKKIEENNVFINKIIAKSSGKIVLISSIASDVFTLIPYYNYPKIKYYSELLVKKTKNFEIIKIGIIGNRFELERGFYGQIKSTSIDKFEKLLEEINFNYSTHKISECWELKSIYNNNYIFKLIYFFQQNIYKFSSRMFYLFRPLLILYRIIGYKNYGYTFIANKLK
jgi:hypothetical protein